MAATINPISTSIRLILTLGEEDGKNLTQSVSFSGMNVSADAETLQAAAGVLAKLMEHPVLQLRKHDVSAIVE